MRRQDLSELAGSGGIGVNRIIGRPLFGRCRSDHGGGREIFGLEKENGDGVMVIFKPVTYRLYQLQSSQRPVSSSFPSSQDFQVRRQSQVPHKSNVAHHRVGGADSASPAGRRPALNPAQPHHFHRVPCRFPLGLVPQGTRTTSRAFNVQPPLDV